MAKLDNPAGRLHTLLMAFVQQSTGNTNVIATWRKVFEAESDFETIQAMVETAHLVPEIGEALRRVGDRDQVHLYWAFAEQWINVVIFPRFDVYGPPAQANLPEKHVFSVLAGVSSFLSAVASEGPVPDLQVVHGLSEKVAELIEEILKDDSLPEEVRRSVLEHLHRLQQALDHFRLGGPGAVKAATERLVGAVALAPSAVQRHGVWTKVIAVAGMAWTAFTAGGPAAQQGLESWEHVTKALTGG